MITVVGVPAFRATEPSRPAGRACDVAIAAAARGARVELVGRIGDDPMGDRLVIALSKAGVGHAAALRDPARATPLLEPVPLADDDATIDGFHDPVDPPAAATATAPRLQAGDVELGLRYVESFSVLVVTDDSPADVLPAVVDAASFSGAHLVLLLAGRRPVPGGVPAEATVLVAPDVDDDGEFAALVGAYAASIDAGRTPAEAFAVATGTAGWEPASDDEG